jgi:hypothetical protein
LLIAKLAVVKSSVFFVILFFCQVVHITALPGWPEIWWAAGHPLAAFKVKKITKHCDKIVDHHQIREQLDSFSTGGKADAYRHMFYMAAYAQKIDGYKLEKLGMAHERTNRKQFEKGKKEEREVPDFISCLMDLVNNETGIIIGSENQELQLKQLSDLIISEILKGKGMIIMRNKKGQYINCDKIPLDIKTFKGKWNIPKCLSHSDYKPED